MDVVDREILYQRMAGKSFRSIGASVLVDMSHTGVIKRWDSFNGELLSVIAHYLADLHPQEATEVSHSLTSAARMERLRRLGYGRGWYPVKRGMKPDPERVPGQRGKSRKTIEMYYREIGTQT